MGFTPTDYFEWFSDLGVAVFDIQPYLSRGVESQWFYEVSEEAATVDAYKALDILSKDPRIDRDRIILLGWSYGGMVVNNAHQQFFIDKIKPENEFQAFISYYPFCSLVKENIKTSDKPLILLMGEKDRMCPFELCQDYFDVIKKSSLESEIHIFENSYHRFDFNLLPRSLNIGRAETWNEEYLQEVINNNKRYDIGEIHKDLMGPNGFSYISLLSDSEKDKILDTHREDSNYIGYNKKADEKARKIMAKIISEL
jgi:dienelactone hydrolase